MLIPIFRTRCIMLVLAVLTLLAAPLHIGAQRDFQSVGLVLSGGGAKGIAHIGVIQALEENNIPIDYITGTSMGAIVGGLYAAGYTPQEMLDLLLSRDFSYWSTGRIDPNQVYYFTKSAQTPSLIDVPIVKADSSAASMLPKSLISPLPMNFAFMELFSAYTAQCHGDFDKLFVPYRSVCSDITAKQKKVWRKGNLGDAIRTSMSFPIVFAPLKIDGHMLYDGGIYDNFPVDVMREDFNPSIMIGVDVSTPSSGNGNLIDQLELLIMQKNNYELPAEEGIKMHIDLNEFALLDFQKAKEISQVGYDHAMSMMDSIKTRITARADKDIVRLRRQMFKSATPYVRFDASKITVSGGTRHQNEFIDYLFRSNNKADTFGIDHARESYYRAITPGRLQNLMPSATYSDSTGLFSLDLQATVKSNFKAGIGGYVTSSTNSFLFLNAGYSTMSFHSLSAQLNGWIGQSYMAGDANLALRMHTHIPSALSLHAVVSRLKFFESDYLFYEDKVPTFILNLEAFGRLDYSLAWGKHGKISAAIGYGHMYDRFYQSNTETSYKEGRDKARYYLSQARLEYEYNNLDNQFVPSSGHSLKMTAMGILGHYRYYPTDTSRGSTTGSYDWLQFELTSRNYFSLSRHWGIGLESDILLSTRPLVCDYNASIIQAPSYSPAPSIHNSFNPAFRANSFIGISGIPFWKMNDSFSIRTTLSSFIPIRKIHETANGEGVYGDWLGHAEFFGELSAVYSFPFATLRGYVNYMSYPARNWNCGISLGLYILAPRFLR